jgi:hypothetical protein
VANSSLSLLKRVLLASAIVFSLVVVGGAEPAAAEELACDDARQLIADLIREESQQGLTIELMTEFDALIPVLESCEPEEQEYGLHVPPKVRRWAPLVSAYFRADDIDRALCLMEHESGGDHRARNTSSGAAGLMQVMPFWAGHFGYSTKDLYEPAVNLRVASLILDKQGWRAWSPFVRGLCR